MLIHKNAASFPVCNFISSDLIPSPIPLKIYLQATMLLNFKSVLLRALLVLSARCVDAHSIEILSCLTTTGDLRVFVRHWHSEVGSVADADEMVIDGAPLPPNGIINDVATLVSPWPELFATGCSTPVVQEDVCTGQLFDSRDDFVWYDFPTTCDVPVSYVFEEGTTVILEDGCKPPYGPAPMYPVTISGTFADTSPPVIYVNGLECPSPLPIVINALTRECDDQGAHVGFIVSALDDCDLSPSVTSVPMSGSFFPIGSSTVLVTSEDAAGNESTCTFTVNVSQDPDLCVPTASPVGRPTPPPVPPQTECLGCNFFSSVLGRPVGSALENSCSMEMADMVIKGESGRCALPSNIFQRECLEYPCSFEATFKIRINSRSCPGGCKLVVWDGSEEVIAVSIAPSSHGKWLSFSYTDTPKCECRTHRIKAAFSCPGQPPYVLTQRAEYTCSECERTPILG